MRWDAMGPEPPEKQFIDHLERHQGVVQRVARLYTHNAEDRRDLVQEILYQLWRAWPRYRGEARVTTWMYRIALNTALTGLRRGRRAPELLPLDPDQSGPAVDPAAALRGERVRSLHEAIRALGPADRAVVMLQLEGLPHREIGEVLGISENLVNVKLHRIRERLRTMMRDTIDGR